ncbi:chromate transporter [Derxia gummosa]|uniref:Chromate transporter n=1 Tax=Derxia gummosa DSM 723 TaxID=1121388 RepID=A0A8B6XAH8_9BURK|nr:chromate transporter [Derxia gummosa]
MEPHQIASAPPPATVPAIPRREAWWFWLRLGCVSFGGPAGQIALMHRELVERRRWISERRFLHALNYCMLLPGPEAQQLATYLGWLMHRTAGGVVAGGLFVLPGFVLLMLLGAAYVTWGELPVVAGLLHGVKPAVTAIVAHAAWRLGRRVLRGWPLWLLALAALGALRAGLPYPAVIGGAALAGLLGGWLAPARFGVEAGTASAAGQIPPASGGSAAVAPAADGPASGATLPCLIDDGTPPPPHARFSAARLASTLAAGLALWALPMAALVLVFGAGSVLARMGLFFTRASLLTFGGAYAVLPYVWQGMVEAEGWVTPRQMIDSLALGETTPGPLVMVSVFAAFVGGWNQAVLGPQARLAGGLLAATVVLWMTFLPSFVFILAGGPLVEATHGRERLTAPLTAISAAVVGVIASLALAFGAHVLWPAGLAGGVDWTAAGIAVAAALALFRFGRGVIEVIAASALAGALLAIAGRVV